MFDLLAGVLVDCARQFFFSFVDKHLLLGAWSSRPCHVEAICPASTWTGQEVRAVVVILWDTLSATHLVPVVAISRFVLMAVMPVSSSSGECPCVVYNAGYDAAGSNEELVPDLVTDFCGFFSTCSLLIQRREI